MQVALCGLNAHKHAVQVRVEYRQDARTTKTARMDLDSSQTILDVKYGVQERESLLPAMQRLRRLPAEPHAAELVDACTLAELVGATGHALRLEVTLRQDALVDLELFSRGHALPSHHGGQCASRPPSGPGPVPG